MGLLFDKVDGLYVAWKENPHNPEDALVVGTLKPSNVDGDECYFVFYPNTESPAFEMTCSDCRSLARKLSDINRNQEHPND